MQRNASRPSGGSGGRSGQRTRAAQPARRSQAPGSARPTGSPRSSGGSRSTGGTRTSGGVRTARGGRRRRPAGLSGLLTGRRGLIALGGGAVTLIVIIALILLLPRAGTKDAAREAAPALAAANGEATEASAQAGDAATASVEASADGTAAPQSVLPNAYSFKVTPTGDSWRAGKYAPEPQGPGYLPVFRSAGRDDKVIAITVDDCFQTENLRQIIQLAEDAGGKLTIFPIGELLKREALQEVIRYAYSKGFEIENHTWSHDGLYNLSDEELAAHIFDQDRALDMVLGVNYKTHFLRPKGGDDRSDLRTHSYIRQLGYYGIAHWSVSGNAGKESLIRGLTPGAVFLFHCTDKDLATLQGLIPYAVSQGYRLVTLNEMFGYPDNETELLTDDPMTRTVIPLEPYQRDYKTMQATTYDYAAYEVQQALIEKGFLTGEPDGVYGADTAACAAKWQQSEGYTPDGILTPEQQKKLLGVE